MKDLTNRLNDIGGVAPVTKVNEFKDKTASMYLDYVNNFISLQGFADHYDISPERANEIINRGRELLK